ncbi:MAG TPA: hypothetical protein PLF75_03075, partial [Bacteroidales bacterium]|nr:hypothetical protein [Bacteroidales bacterium]
MREIYKAAKNIFALVVIIGTIGFTSLFGGGLQLNELDYYEGRGVNVLVFSNQYNGLFFDEKTAG